MQLALKFPAAVKARQVIVLFVPFPRDLLRSWFCTQFYYLKNKNIPYMPAHWVYFTVFRDNVKEWFDFKADRKGFAWTKPVRPESVTDVNMVDNEPRVTMISYYRFIPCYIYKHDFIRFCEFSSPGSSCSYNNNNV